MVVHCFAIAVTATAGHQFVKIGFDHSVDFSVVIAVHLQAISRHPGIKTGFYISSQENAYPESPEPCRGTIDAAAPMPG